MIATLMNQAVIQIILMMISSRNVMMVILNVCTTVYIIGFSRKHTGIDLIKAICYV